MLFATIDKKISSLLGKYLGQSFYIHVIITFNNVVYFDIHFQRRTWMVLGQQLQPQTFKKKKRAFFLRYQFDSLNILFEIYFSIIFIIVSRNIISTQVCAQIQHSASEYCMFNDGSYLKDTIQANCAAFYFGTYLIKQHVMKKWNNFNSRR